MSELKQLSQRERAEDGFLRYLHGKIKIKKKNTHFLPIFLPYLPFQRMGGTMDEEDSGLNVILATAFKMQFINSMP